MVSTSTRHATLELGQWCADLIWGDVPDAAQQRLRLILLNSFGVTLAGAATTEQAALVKAWRPAPGEAALLGAGRTCSVDAAAWLNSMALVRLELDEGHKHAAGHPGAHGLWAVLSLAADLDSSGADTAAALVVAYEVSSRFGRATALRPGVHPHGSWGVPGAAAGCARLLGLDGAAMAAAIDTGAGMPIAAHFDSALDGNEVRNAWMGASNLSGLAAARIAAAGQAQCTGTAATSLGGVLGEFHAAELTAGLGTRWDLTGGYFKRHASCSFTHPVADVILDLRSQIDPNDVAEIVVETHRLGTALTRKQWDNRLSALFSTPFVAATALVHGAVGPQQSSREALGDRRVQDMADRVQVQEAADLTARLPAERAARVTLRTVDGAAVTGETPNPIGDADFHPLDEAAVLELLAEWLPDSAVTTARRVATDLDGAACVRGLLQELP